MLNLYCKYSIQLQVDKYEHYLKIKIIFEFVNSLNF